jgi:hypothetical protein
MNLTARKARIQPTTLVRSMLMASLLGASLPALADEASDRIRALEAKLESSLQLIEKLSNRLGELERGGRAPGTPPAAAATASADAQAIATLQSNVAQLSESLSKRSGDTGLPVHGFADVGAAWSSGKDPMKLRGFNGGTLDLYLTPQFGQRVKSLIELAVEYGEDGGVALDMERLQLGYTVNDDLTVWLGRFHTPYGLWNTSFHHGANLQTSVFRPRFIDFEDKGGFVPAHSVGLWFSGKHSLDGGKLTYDAYLSNGPSIRDRTLDFNAFTDNNGNKMLGFNLGFAPRGALAGLTVGVHGFGSQVDTVSGAGATLNSTKLRMMGGYAGYDADDWEVVGEYYRFSNADVATGASHGSNAWFAQVGKTLGALTPFVRFEDASLSTADAYFTSQGSGRSYKRQALGVRYAFDPKSSLKLELSNTREGALTQLDADGSPVAFSAARYRRAAMQYSAAF